MNMQKLTKKTIEAIQAAQDTAIEYQNTNVDQCHLLYALMTQENGLIPQLMTKLGKDANVIAGGLERIISRIPKVTGSGRDMNTVYISQSLDKLLNAAEAIAKSMGDEFVSVEHIMLSYFDNADKDIKQLLKDFALEKNDFLKALQDVRGNQRVTTDTPEDTYDVLKKYGQDLVELAKQNKLDPVIGRDSEIRNTILF